MGRPRIRGQHVTLSVLDKDLKPIQVGEISKCSVKELGELKKSRSIGEAGITANKTFEGYDLSFEGGKVDWRLAQLLHRQDDYIYDGARAPYFQVSHKFKYYDGSYDIYTYPEVVIHGYSLDIDANDELSEKFEGFCGEKRNVEKVGGNIAPSYTTIDNTIANLIDYAKGRDQDVGNPS